MNKKNTILATIGALLIIIGISGYFVWMNFQKRAVADTAKEATNGVLPSLNTNPLENKPDLNPANKANPFKNVETNPFK